MCDDTHALKTRQCTHISCTYFAPREKLFDRFITNCLDITHVITRLRLSLMAEIKRGQTDDQLVVLDDWLKVERPIDSTSLKLE